MFKIKNWIWVLIFFSLTCISCARGCVKAATKIKVKNRANKNLKHLDNLIPNEIFIPDPNNNKLAPANNNDKTPHIEYDRHKLNYKEGVNINVDDYQKYLKTQKEMKINLNELKSTKPLKNEEYKLDIDPIVTQPKGIDLGSGLINEK